jgi:hypothetical protein
MYHRKTTVSRYALNQFRESLKSGGGCKGKNFRAFYNGNTTELDFTL